MSAASRVLALALCMAVLGAGCRWPFGREPVATPTGVPQPARAAQPGDFQRGQEAYADGDYAAAARLMGAYASAYPQSEQGDMARYWQAQSLLALGQPLRARDLFDNLAGDPQTSRAVQALAVRGTARSYAVEGDWARAEETYQRLLRRYADAVDTTEVLTALEECARRQNDEAAAREYAQRRAGTAGAAPAAPPLAEPVAPEGRHIVQAGRFSERVRAEALVDRLRRSGFEAFVDEQDHPSAPYAVQAGSFVSRARAEARARALRQHGFQAIVKP